MQTAQVVVATSYGGPESLEVVTTPVPAPGPGEVLVEVRAAGCNQADWKSYSGLWGTDEDKLPLPLGYEAAGVVAALGDGVTGVDVGAGVIAWPIAGGYATHVVVPAGSLTPKPETLDWPEAGGLLLTAAAAWHALEAAGVGEGETVLVHGGAGGVGLMAVQLARFRGARVIATAAPHQHDLVRELGGEAVTFGDGLLERVRELGEVDAALDLVGTDEALDVSLAVTTPERISTIANFGRAFEAGIKVLGAGGDPGDDIREAARPELARLAGTGKLRVVVSDTYPLAQAAAAHRQLREGRTTGKVVLIP